MTKAKPFDIPKREVWEAFKKVKANQGPTQRSSRTGRFYMPDSRILGAG